MEIQINDCPVDFELINEKTVGEVVDSIVDWTQQRNLIFTETSINNSCYSIDKIPDIPLDKVEILNCFVQSKADVVISTLNAASEYCIKADKFIKNSITEGNFDTNEIENIAAGVDWIIEVLVKICDLLGLNINEFKYKDEPLDYYVSSLKKFTSGIYESKTENNKLISSINKNLEIFTVVNDILKMLLMSENMRELVVQSIDSPDVLLDTLKEIKKQIPSQIKNLEEIAVSYQTRNDNTGAEKFDNFINFIFNYTRTCLQIAPVFGIDLEKIIIDDISLNRKNNEIQDHLNNITDVMENNDIISLSDILEYEMKSSLENLEIYIDALIGVIEKKSA